MSDPRKPKFVQSAEILGNWVGKQADDVVAEYRGAVHESRYPGPDCLMPEQLLGFVETSDLDPQHLAHAAECAPCGGLLEAARPSAERRKAFLEALRSEAAPSIELAAAPPAETSWFAVERFAGAFRRLRSARREAASSKLSKAQAAAVDRDA